MKTLTVQITWEDYFDVDAVDVKRVLEIFYENRFFVVQEVLPPPTTDNAIPYKIEDTATATIPLTTTTPYNKIH